MYKMFSVVQNSGMWLFIEEQCVQCSILKCGVVQCSVLSIVQYSVLSVVQYSVSSVCFTWPGIRDPPILWHPVHNTAHFSTH